MPVLPLHFRPVRLPAFTHGFTNKKSLAVFPDLYTNLVGYWVPGLVPSGLTLFDLSGEGHHGTLTNMGGGSWVKSDSLILPGNVLQLDSASTQYVSMGDVPRAENVAQLSVGAWVNLFGFSGNGYFFSKFQNGQGTWYISYSTSSRAFSSRLFSVSGTTTTNSNTYSIGDEPVDHNQYYFVCLTYDGINTLLYVNGELHNTNTLSGTLKDQGVDLLISGNSAHNNLFDGKFAAGFIYDRALLPSEILLEYYLPHALFRRRATTDLYAIPAGAPAPPETQATLPIIMQHHDQFAGGIAI